MTVRTSMKLYALLGKSVSSVLKVEERFRDVLIHMKLFASGLMPLRIDRKRHYAPRNGAQTLVTDNTIWNN
jgi:hypothetical protein